MKKLTFKDFNTWTYKKYSIMIILIGVAGVALMGLGIAYAYYTTRYKNNDPYSGVNVVGATINMEITKYSGDFDLCKNYPISDEEGSSCPYNILKVKNNSGMDLTYSLLMELLNDNTLSPSDIKVTIASCESSNDSSCIAINEAKSLSTFLINNSPVNSNAISYNLFSGNVIDIEDNTSQYFGVKFWIDESSTAENSIFDYAFAVTNKEQNGFNGITIGVDNNNNSSADIGDIINIGDERFYVISNDGTIVKALAEYNLLVGSNCTTSSNCTEISKTSNDYGFQSSDSLGYQSDGYPYVGITLFSSNTQKGTNLNDYVGSIIEKYINMYKNNINSLYGLNVSTSALTKNELLNLKKKYTNNTSATLSIENINSWAPNWLFNTSFWLATSEDESTTNVWTIKSNGDFNSISNSNNSDYGVRPVISFAVKDINTSSTINPTGYKLTLTDYSGQNIKSIDNIKIGDSVTVGNEQFYVLPYSDGSTTKNGKFQALAKYHILIGSTCDNEGNNCSEISPNTNGYGLQNAIARGLDETTGENIGVVDFYSEAHQGSNIYDYNGSQIQIYVNDYVDLLKKLSGTENITGKLFETSNLDILFSLSSGEFNVGLTENEIEYFTNVFFDGSSWWGFDDIYLNDYSAFAIIGEGWERGTGTIHSHFYGLRPIIEFSISDFS